MSNKWVLSNKTFDYRNGRIRPNSKASIRGMHLYLYDDKNGTYIPENALQLTRLCDKAGTAIIIYIPDIGFGLQCDDRTNIFLNGLMLNLACADLNHSAVVVPVVWPCSEDKVSCLNSADTTGYALYEFMDTLKNKDKSVKVNIISHGVGSRIALRCMEFALLNNIDIFNNIYFVEPMLRQDSLSRSFIDCSIACNIFAAVSIYYNTDLRSTTMFESNMSMRVYGVSELFTEVIKSYNLSDLFRQKSCVASFDALAAKILSDLCENPYNCGV